MIAQTDDGFAQSWANDDLYLEAACSVADPAWGPAELWPQWTDLVRVGVGAPLDDDETLDPVPPRPDNTPDPDDLDDEEEDDLLWEGSDDEWDAYVDPPEDERRGWAGGHHGDEAWFADQRF